MTDNGAGDCVVEVVKAPPLVGTVYATVANGLRLAIAPDTILSKANAEAANAAIVAAYGVIGEAGESVAIVAVVPIALVVVSMTGSVLVANCSVCIGVHPQITNTNSMTTNEKMISKYCAVLRMVMPSSWPIGLSHLAIMNLSLANVNSPLADFPEFRDEIKLQDS